MEWLLDLPDLWQTLQQETRPIVLYGMGDGANKIIDVCKSKGIPIQGVFASDDFVRAKKFHEWDIEHLATLEERYGELVILLAFGTSKPDLLEHMQQIAQKHTFYVPDVPVVAGEELFDLPYLQKHWDELIKINELWEDDFSRKTFQEILAYKVTGKMNYLFAHPVTREEMFAELFSWGEDEIFVDAGAYRGDTVEEFISMTQNNYKKIYALEPDGKNYIKLKKAVECYPNIQMANVASWDKEEMLYFEMKSGRGGRINTGEPNTRAIAIDSMVIDHKATYIKYDVEGAEVKALEGARNTIEHSHPKLLVSAYHRPDDLYTLPQMIQEMWSGYRFYLRRNHGLPAWDINIIAI